MLLSSVRRATTIERWSLANALGMLSAAAGTILLERLWPLLIGIGFLVGLIILERERWTPQNRFGQANAVTAVRIGLLGLFPACLSSAPAIITLSLLFLAADGVDGWLARRTGSASTFGAFFDKETDSLFVLFLCASAVLDGHLPLWMIGIGLLRYTFVVIVFLLDPPQKTEERSNWSRYVHGAMVTALLLTFLPFSAVRPLVYIAGVALVASFGRSFWQITRTPDPLE